MGIQAKIKIMVMSNIFLIRKSFDYLSIECAEVFASALGEITVELSVKTTDRWVAIAVIYNYYKLFSTWGI